jgi:regulator of RNase E activity RraA
MRLRFYDRLLRMIRLCSLMVSVGLAVSAQAQLFQISKEDLLAITKEWKGERFDDGRPKVPEALLDEMHGLTVEEIWGVLPRGARPDQPSYANQYVDGWEILHPGKKIVGRAVTAQFMPLRADLNELVISRLKSRGVQSAAHQWVIDQLQPGDVFVADLFGKKAGGTVVGDNLATAVYSATRLGKNGGLVVDGGIRDLQGIAEIDMSLYYRHAHPSAIAGVTLTGYNIPVRIGEATVVPGDVVFGDREGIYFVPPQFVKPILERAVETHIHDEWTKDKFLKGRYKSSELYPRPRDPALQREYEEYKKKRLGERKPQ